MSGADLIGDYGPLEVFFGAEEGVSLRADNSQFLSVVQRDDIYGIEAAKQTKDQWCKFFVEKLGNGKVRFKDRRGFYLTRVERHGRHNIEAAKLEPDVHCEFQVYTRNGRVIFQADNGLFLSRIYWDSANVHSLEAAKKDADVFCEFVPDIGDFFMTRFEIVSVDINSSSLTKKRITIKEKEYINLTSLEQKHTFNMTWEKKVTEVTSWKRAWGLDTTTSATTHCFGGLYTVTVSYDDAHGKICSKEKIISEVEGVSLTVPPQKRIIAKLMVTMDENAEIPFTAKIKKINDNGKIEMLTETGNWKGVVYGNVTVEIEEHFLQEF